MDREAVMAQINALAPRITQSAWYGKTYRDFWDWFSPEYKAIESLAESEQDREWMQAALLPLKIDTDVAELVFPEAGFTSTIQPFLPEQTFEERWGLQEGVAEALNELRQAAISLHWKGQSFAETQESLVGQETIIREMARLPGEREKIEAELSDIWASVLRLGGKPPSDKNP